MAMLLVIPPRDNAAPLQSPSFVVPPEAAGQRLRFTVMMSTATRRDPTLNLQLDFFLDLGGGQSQHLAGMFVPGGPFTSRGRVDPPPFIEIAADEFIGQTIFMRSTTPTLRRYGVQIESL